MTIREISRQLHSLSVGGYFNRQKVSAAWLEHYISNMFRVGCPSLIMEVALPDGWWYFKITKYPGGFDYFIPESRKQEARLKAEIFGNSAS